MNGVSFLSKYSILFAIIPAIIILLTAYFLDLYPKRSTIAKFLDFIAEKDLDIMMQKSGANKSFTRLKYQGTRILVAVGLSLTLLLIFPIKSMSTWLIILVYAFVIYKGMYFILIASYSDKIKRLNNELPYLIKTVVFMCHLYPLTNSLERAIIYAPDDFKVDLEELMQNIHDNPTEFTPYQMWIDKYDGRLKNLDLYLKMLYKMKTTSSSEDQDKLLDNINAEVSADVTRARRAKNGKINSTVRYIGLLPSGFCIAALIAVFVSILGSSFIF